MPARIRVSAFCVLASIVTCAMSIACSSGSTSVLSPVGPTSDIRCNLTVAASTSTVGAGGGSGKLTVTTTRECRWSVSGATDWIKFAAPIQGQGSADIGYAIEPNRSTQARKVELTIGDEHVTISQAGGTCSWKVTPDSATVAATGGEVRTSISTEDFCSWRITAPASWITITSAESGSGSAEISLRVAANAGSERSVTMPVQAAAFDITQRSAAPLPAPPSPGPPKPSCTFEVTPVRFDNVASTSSDLNVDIKTTSGCAWTAASQAMWINIGPTTGTGSARVKLSITANLGDKRTGTATIAGQTVMVNQNAAPCAYTVKPDSFHISSGSQTADITVTTNRPSCTVGASTSAGWVHIGPYANAGSGKIPLSFDRNGGGKRSATVAVTGENFNASIKIDQDGK